MAIKTALPPKNAPGTREPKRLCVRCGQKKIISDFYLNREWEDQQCRDVWCKECISQLTSKGEIREYFWENNRGWDGNIWEIAKKIATGVAEKNATYAMSSEEVKERLLERMAAQQVSKIMHRKDIYKFEDHYKEGSVMSYQEAKEQGLIIEEKDPNIKVYSEVFNGYFKQDEVKYLETYYANLENDFDLDTENLRDYARKLAKASMLADRAQDNYAAGRCDLSVVKDALSQFDMLSKSANFAACKRKPGETGGLGSWAELTYKLETSGHPCTRKIEWEKDDVDRTIEEFKYLVEALGLDTI